MVIDGSGDNEVEILRVDKVAQYLAQRQKDTGGAARPDDNESAL